MKNFMRILISFLFVLMFLDQQNACAQVSILNGDGSPLTTTWCYEDTLHPIQGLPAGGTFSGCGIVEQNGAWYFNPRLAAEGVTVFAYTCSLAYTPPASTGLSRIYRPVRINTPVLIDAGPDRVICRNGNFTLPVSIVYGSSYKFSWSPGIYLKDSTKNPASGSISVHGSETFYLTVRDVNSNCMAYDTVTLHDKSVFATVEGDVPDSICTGGTLRLGAGLYEGYEYLWITGEEGGTIGGTSLDYAYHTPGDYELMLVVSDEFCSDTSAHEVHVEDFKLDLITDRLLVNRGDPVRLTASGTPLPFTVTSWSPAVLFPDQSAAEQLISADSSHTYIITGESPLGCRDTASVFVSVKPVIDIPNSFTPNGDGKNDVFRVASYGDIVRILHFDVFDRWGKRVWTGRGADNSRGWDGSYDGTPAAAGTYFYRVETENLQGERFYQTGDITLIR